jgi:hypothetical protein
MGFRGFYLKEYRATKPLEYHPMRWLAAILASTAAVYFLRDVHAGIKTAITLLIAGVLVWAYFRFRHVMRA